MYNKRKEQEASGRMFLYLLNEYKTFSMFIHCQGYRVRPTNTGYHQQKINEVYCQSTRSFANPNPTPGGVETSFQYYSGEALTKQNRFRYGNSNIGPLAFII